MDYSLLLAIEKKEGSLVEMPDNSKTSRDSSYTKFLLGKAYLERLKVEEDREEVSLRQVSSFTSSERYQLESADDRYIFHVSVIDFLQEWNFKKRLERFAKTKL